MQALACNPWVRRVTREDVCSRNVSRRGEGAQDGQILRAKRRRPPTATDRARAYAFERIPPSDAKNLEGAAAGIGNLAAPRHPWTANRLNSECFSTDREEKEKIKNVTAIFNSAPAHGAVAGCLFATKDGEHNGGSTEQGQRLMHPAAVEISDSPTLNFAPSCKIDLRGCSRRPLPLPLVAAESEAERGASPAEQTPSHGAGVPSDDRNDHHLEVGRLRDRHRERRGRKPGGNQSYSPTVVGFGATSNCRRTARLTNGNAEATSPDVAVMVGAPLRPLRRSRWRNVVARDDRSSCPLKSEAQDMDELTSLLRVSRRIFSKAEGFEEVDNRPQKQRASMASIHNGVVFTQGHHVELGHTGGVCDQLGAGAAAGFAPRNSVPRKSNSPPPDCSLKSRRFGEGSGGNSSSRRSQVVGPLIHDPDESSQITLTRASVLKGSRGQGEGNDENPGNAESQRHRKSTIEGDGAHQAVDKAEGTPAPPVEVNDTSDAPDEENSVGQTAIDKTAVTPENHGHDDSSLPISAEAFDPTSNRNHAAHHPHGDWDSSPALQPFAEQYDAAQQAADMNNELTLTEEGYTTGVVDAANWLGSPEDNNNGGWAYDEATASWYASGIAGGETNDQGEGLDGVGGGWQYDEQTSSWYQGESVRHVRDPQELRIVRTPERAAIATDNVPDGAGGASGGEDRNTSRRGSSQKETGKLPLDLGVGENVRGGLNSSFDGLKYHTKEPFPSVPSATWCPS